MTKEIPGVGKGMEAKLPSSTLPFESEPSPSREKARVSEKSESRACRFPKGAKRSTLPTPETTWLREELGRSSLPAEPSRMTGRRDASRVDIPPPRPSPTPRSGAEGGAA